MYVKVQGEESAGGVQRPWEDQCWNPGSKVACCMSRKGSSRQNMWSFVGYIKHFVFYCKWNEEQLKGYSLGCPYILMGFVRKLRLMFGEEFGKRQAWKKGHQLKGDCSNPDER